MLALFSPAMLALLLMLAALAFAALALRMGSKLFGTAVLTLGLVQMIWLVAHFTGAVDYLDRAMYEADIKRARAILAEPAAQ